MNCIFVYSYLFSRDTTSKLNENILRYKSRYFKENAHTNTECFVCFEFNSNIIFDPCGHKICKLCFFKIKNKTNTCIYCREPIIISYQIPKSF